MFGDVKLWSDLLIPVLRAPPIGFRGNGDFAVGIDESCVRRLARQVDQAGVRRRLYVGSRRLDEPVADDDRPLLNQPSRFRDDAPG